MLPSRNYQKELNQLLLQLEKENKRPTLLMHSCCAPCSSYVMEYLSHRFDMTMFFYNPNISPQEEYDKRVSELLRLSRVYPVRVELGTYEPERFFAMAKGMEQLPEGGERCFLCYEMRMREAAVLAKKGRYEYFTTTLSISPHKNAQKINEIGEKLEQEFGVKHLPSDFKKKDGYKRSIELSQEYNLYRQNYCGCVYSKLAVEREERSFL